MDLRTEEGCELFIRPGTEVLVRGTDRSQIQEPSQGTEGDWASAFPVLGMRVLGEDSWMPEKGMSCLQKERVPKGKANRKQA